MANKKSDQYQTYHVVVIEWDGEQPPTRWYDRLHRLAGRVRGDKEQSVIERRTDKALIVQEGCILCPSESLAKTLATLARDEFEAEHVMIGKTRLTDTFGVSREDRQILGRVEMVLGRKGRPPKAEDWAVTCLEEMESFNVRSSGPYQCPSCKGLRIHNRRGKNAGIRLKAREVQDLSPFDLWISTRFRYGSWSPAFIRIKGYDQETGENLDLGNPQSITYENEDGGKFEAWVSGLRDEEPEIYNEREEQIVDALRSSRILDKQEEIPVDIFFDILDAILVNRAYMSDESRLQNRVEAAQIYFRRGGTPAGISLAEMPTLDYLSAAGPLDPDVVAKYALTWG